MTAKPSGSGRFSTSRKLLPVLLACQLALGTTISVSAEEQHLVNATPPVPEMPASQMERLLRLVKRTRTGKPAAAKETATSTASKTAETPTATIRINPPVNPAVEEAKTASSSSEPAGQAAAATPVNQATTSPGWGGNSLFEGDAPALRGLETNAAAAATVAPTTNAPTTQPAPVATTQQTNPAASTQPTPAVASTQPAEAAVPPTTSGEKAQLRESINSGDTSSLWLGSEGTSSEAAATASTTSGATTASTEQATTSEKSAAETSAAPSAAATSAVTQAEATEATAPTAPLTQADATAATTPATQDKPAVAAQPSADGAKAETEYAAALNKAIEEDSIVFERPKILRSGTGIAATLTAIPSLPDGYQVGGPIIIDNDEEIEQEQTIAYEELPTDDGKTHVKAGAKFPVVIISELNSKTAKKGDPVQGRLKYDLKIGERLVAKRGSMVRGHLDYVLKARTTLHSLVSPERWYKNSGVLGFKFDEIVNERGEHIPLVAEPAKQALIIKNKGDGRVLGVNHKGQIVGPWSQQLRYKAVRVGLNFALAPAGVMSFGAMPLALGVMGAVNPSFAFMKPVGLNVRHRRIKGFLWGALSGVPGSWLIEDTTCKGQEAIIKPGDEFLAEIRQEFTGEPAAEAELMPGAGTKVKGEVVGTSNKKAPKKGK